MNCPQCGTENPEAARFCLNCATLLVLVCAECGTELPPNAKFCFNCAAPAGGLAAAVPSSAPAGERGAPLVVQAIERLIPSAYAQRLLSTRGQVARERRTVTILFSDVKGSTAMAQGLDPEDWLEVMDGAFKVLIEPVYHYEGTLARLMGDAVLAFFGAPIAHEDDPERAIRAALDIIRGARKYASRLERERGISGFDVRVGIHTGLVVVGEVGSDLRVEYTAMGDAVNLAARTEQNAPPGGLLITHDTYRHVQGVFDVLAQEPLLVKGRPEAVQTYLVERAKPRAFRKPVRGVEGIETRMVGREAELKRLQEALYVTLEDRELQVVTVSGEAGVGKSRLLHEFDTWSELLPAPFYYFKGRALPEMQNQPYGLVRDLVAFRFQIQESDPAGAVREKLEAGAAGVLGPGERSEQAAHYIGHMAGFELGDSPYLPGRQDDAQELRDRALASLAGYLQAMAAQTAVLILLEDLHWADDSSLDALNQLALALVDQPVMIACAARPSLFERRPHWGEGQPFHSRLALEPLSKWDSRQLVAEILQKADEVPQALRDLIVAGAEGNPFFIEELIKMLIEDGVIVTGDEQWRLEPARLVDVQVPPTLRGVLQARLDRLPLEERTVLQQASVVGRLFWDRAVARIHESMAGDAGPIDVPVTLSALRGREMVFQRETSAFADALEYIFKHNMLREVAYESVLKRVRGVYHGLVADWLLEQAGERAGEHTNLIADHLALAGRTEEAVEYLLQAGDRARGLYAHHEAIQAYERAMVLLKEQGDSGRAARTLMKLGLVHHNAFAFVRSRQTYDEAFVLWQRAARARPAESLSPAPHALRLAPRYGPTLDRALTTVNNPAIEQLFSGLVEFSPEMDVMPDLAESWEVLEGGRRYIFHLREGVAWSDGLPVTAADFEYAWKRLLDPATGSPNAMMLYALQGARAFHRGQAREHEVGVKAVDARTLLVELEGPTGYFLQLLACSSTFPVPRHVVEKYGRAWTEPGKIVSNGPFMLASWQPGEHMVLVRYPAYHGVFTGNLERVELTFLSRDVTPVPLQMYEAGGLDAVDMASIPMPERGQARQAHAGEIVSVPLLFTQWISLFPTGPPLDDLRVRRALVLAADRERLSQVVLRSYYNFPATGGFVPPGMPGHSAGIGLPYDPDQARNLLAEAGYPGGRGFPPLDLVTWSASYADTVEYLQAQWLENLGVEITSQLVELVAYQRESREPHRERPHLWLSSWRADYPDPHNFLRVGEIGESRRPWGGVAYENLVEKACTATDQEERMALYRQADRLLIEDAFIMPLVYGRGYFLVKPWVTRYPMSPLRDAFWKDVVIEPH
jgi:ABC-type oligopeptide transport system substrate-binding subunit/class 3 adenylate cyclase/tetratricopeptide (TPR) repeat protein